MPRFLHTADWQVGRQYRRFTAEDAAILYEARFEVVARLATLATEQACDAILVAGDIFDSQTVSDRSLRRVFNAMAGFDGPWVLLPGNHDAALAESVWRRAQRLEAVPEQVRLALDSGVIELAEQGLAVLAAPLVQRHTYEDLTAAFDTMETAPGLLRIGLAHGSVQGILAQDIAAANPVAPDRVERARLDYLALGDWHGARQINARCWYSGTPEPERFRDNEPGYALVVEIAEPGAEPTVSRHTTGRYDWLQWRRELTLPSDIAALEADLAALRADTVLELRLRGQLTLQDEQRLSRVLSVASAKLRSLSCERSELALAPTDEDIAALRADGYLGEVVATLRERQVEAGEEVCRDALLILAGLLRERAAGEESA